MAEVFILLLTWPPKSGLALLGTDIAQHRVSYLCHLFLHLDRKRLLKCLLLAQPCTGDTEVAKQPQLCFPGARSLWERQTHPRQ